jgi:hypothetical protein
MNGGIVVTDGATFRISEISITINEVTGEVTCEGGQPSIHYDVCPVWLAIATKHLEEAKQAHTEMLHAKNESADELKFIALEREFRASMQAMTSCAIEIDALYAAVKQKMPKTAKPFDSEKRRGARHAQVSEAIKQAFQLKQAGFEKISEAIEQIFAFRDQAVHPTGNFNAPVLHPELNVGVEKRQVIFRYDNAFKIVQFTVAMISELAAKTKPKNEILVKYAEDLKNRMTSIRSDPILKLSPLEL